MTNRRYTQSRAESSISSFPSLKKANVRVKTIRGLPDAPSPAVTKKVVAGNMKTASAKGKSTKKGSSRRVVEAPNGTVYTIDRVKCLKGGHYVRIAGSDGVAYAPYEQFAGSATEAMHTLRSASLIIVGTKVGAEIRDAVGTFRLKQFKTRPLLNRPGWTKGHFALASGAVFSPASGKKAEILFRPNPKLCRQAGKPAVWKREVATRLVGQHLASFILMTAFAAPLLSYAKEVGNFAFEITGSGGKGKSTLQQILASTAGFPFPDGDGHYGMSLNATANGLEVAMFDYADMVMPLEEATLFNANGSVSSRASSFLEIVFRSSDGTTKSRMNGAKQQMLRFIPVISGNEAIADVLNKSRGKVRAAAADRLITLKVDDDRPFGVFDFVPAGFKNGGEFAAALKSTISQNYGLAMPRYLSMLVTTTSSDELKLRHWIKSRLASFRRRLGVDYNDGSASRVADAFGLVYAGGLLAQKYGILPKKFECFAAAKVCYRGHVKSARLLPPFIDRLSALACRADVVDLDAVGLSEMSKIECDRPPAYLKTNRSGQREVLLTTKALKRAFPDWNGIKDDGDVMKALVSDKDRRKAKRSIRTNHTGDWVYCFTLPDDE